MLSAQKVLFLTSKTFLKYHFSKRLPLVTLFKIVTHISFQHYWSLHLALNHHPPLQAFIITQVYKTAILQKAYLQAWPLSSIQELGFQKGSHISRTDESGSLHLNCLFKQYIYAKCLFSFKECTNLVCSKKRVTRIKTLRTEYLMSFTSRQHFIHVVIAHQGN